VLLLHGFSGSPHEVRDLGERLHARGYSVIAPALPGHRGDVHELDHVSADDYLEMAVSRFEALERAFERVYVIGLSMGGALGLHIAQRKRPAGVVTINAPVRMPSHVYGGVHLIARHRASTHLPVNPRAYFGIAGYPTVPASAVAAFLSVVTRVREGLAGVHAPLLVLHSARDLTVPFENAALIDVSVGSRDRNVIVLKEGQHLMTVGRWLDVIEPHIGEFLERMDRERLRDGRTSELPS
jgi:carboxylesterase